MFGRVERAMHRNMVAGLAVVAALLLLTGLVVCLASPPPHAHPGTAQPGTAQPGTAQPGTAQRGTAQSGSPRPEPARVAPATP